MHSVYYSSTGGIPKSMLKIKMKDDTYRIEELSDFLHVVDKKDVYLKGIITIETTFTEVPITHEAWIEVPINDYVLQIEKAREKSDLIIYGKLASILPFYKDVVGLDSMWNLNKENQIGQIKAVSNSILREDQTKPITEERLKKMMEFVYHPELYTEKAKFNQSFDERLSGIIQQAKTEFELKGNCFLIDIGNLKEVLFQLIPSDLTAIEHEKEIGIHISNDESNENYTMVKKRMAEICATINFIKLELDGIETYQKNYHYHDDNLIEEVKLILESIFCKNLDELDIEISEM